MKIKSFVRTSENVVQIQIWTAMTAILLMKFLKENTKYDWLLSNLITFIRLNLFVKVDLQQWLDNPFAPKISRMKVHSLAYLMDNGRLVFYKALKTGPKSRKIIFY